MDEKILITGVTGQDGIFLTSELLQQDNIKIIGTTRNTKNKNFFKYLNYLNKNLFIQNIELINLNLQDQDSVEKFIEYFKPTKIFNLTGPSNVNNSIDNKDLYTKHLISSFHNLLNALEKCKLDSRLFQASSSEMFKSSKKPLNEESDFDPRNPYSSSKYEIHKKILKKSKNSNLKLFSGIMFNHESEFRSNDFLIMKIIEAALKIKSTSEKKKLTLGSIDIIRDWSFAGDVMKAVNSITELDDSNHFVIGSGKGVSIKNIVEHIFSSYKLNWENHINIDSNILRSGDPLSIISDPQKLVFHIDWKPEYDIFKTIDRMIHFKNNENY